PSRERKPAALPAGAPQDRIHQRSRAALADLAGHVDRVVDRGRRGNTIEVQQLEEREPEDLDDLGIEPVDWPARVHGNHPIERALPAEGTSGDLSGEGAIPLVAEAGPRTRQGGGQVCSAPADSTK